MHISDSNSQCGSCELKKGVYIVMDSMLLDVVRNSGAQCVNDKQWTHARYLFITS